MSTAEVLIDDAFNNLEIKIGENALSAAEMALGMRYLNRMMVTWASNGINIGFAKVSVKTDETEIPDYAEEAVIYGLSVRLAPGFGVAVTQALGMAAGASLKALELRAINLHETEFPNTLPIGGGNRINAGTNTRFFTRRAASDLLSGAGDQLDDDEGEGLTLT